MQPLGVDDSPCGESRLCRDIIENNFKKCSKSIPLRFNSGRDFGSKGGFAIISPMSRKLFGCLVSVGVFLVGIFPSAIVFAAPSGDPPAGGGGIIQIDPDAPQPSLKINSLGEIMSPSVWKGTIIGTMFGGTGCSVDTTAGIGPLRTTCLQGAATGNNSDITSLSPPGNLLLTPTGNVGIGTGAVTPSATLSVGVAGANIPFQVNASGDLIRIKNISYLWPGAQGGSGSVLTNDGGGNLSWAPGLGGISAGGWTEDASNNRVYVTNIGNKVGIGTPAPAEKLDIVGNINIEGDFKYAGQNYISARGNGSSFYAGYQSGSASTATGNTGVGYQAFSAITTGQNNTALGNSALKANTVGSSNTAVGASALSLNASSNSNTAIGDSALLNTTGGGNNTAVGYHAGLTNTTGTGNTFIGSGADTTLPNLTNATAIGYNAKVSASNSIVLGQVVTATNVGIGTTTPTALLSVGPNAFQVNSFGDVVKIKGIDYAWPGSHGQNTYVLTNDGAGHLNWLPNAAGGGGIGTGGWTDDALTGTVHTTNPTRPVAIGTTSSPSSLFTIRRSTAGNALAIQNSSGSDVLTIDDTGTVTAGFMPWARITPATFPTGCNTGLFVTAVGTNLICATATITTGGWEDDSGNNKIYTVDTGRDVGIGITTPLAKLHVDGNTIIEGMVGIGTTTPAQKLTVNGVIYSTSGGFRFPDGTTQSTAANGLSGFGMANRLAKWTGSSTLGDSEIFEDGTGKIGIGSGFTPSAKLHVQGGTVLVNNNSSSAVSVTPLSGTPAIFATSGATSSTTVAGLGTVTANAYGTSVNAAFYGNVLSGSTAAGLEIVQSGTGDIARFKDGSTTAFIIKDGGNVGIGTTTFTPAAKLEVVSNTDDAIRLTKTAGTAGRGNFFVASSARDSS